jgi:tetratricopeptide (TPR) repeat protein
MTASTSQSQSDPSQAARPWLRNAAAILFLFGAVVVAYWPAMHGGFLWDDHDHFADNKSLRSLQGLWDIWFKPGATCQYYPMTFTGFWVGYQLWGLNPLGYHLLNVFLHGLVAVLLWQVLARLRVRGAWLAGALFALHPVCVMSVAWMTELKNTLSAALALGAGWAYVRFAGLGVYEGEKGVNTEHRTPNTEHRMLQADPKRRSWIHSIFGVRCSMFDVRASHSAASSCQHSPRTRWWFYLLALLLFQLGLFAKTAVSFLPVSLLLVTWWQRERLRWRDLWPLVPMLGLVAVMSRLTFHVERLYGALGPQFDLGWLDRALISGRSFWFYLRKLFFPHQLTFIYERWQVDAGDWRQYLFPLAAAGVLMGLWLGRRRLGRGLFVGLMHFYVCTSLLILLTVIYMTRYTFVSDHWQYFGCMSVMAAVAAGISALRKSETQNSKLEGNPKPEVQNRHHVPFSFRVSSRFARLRTSSFGLRFSTLFCGALLITLGVLTWRQCGMYTDMERLWRTTLARNPRAFLAHNNLGELLTQQGELDEATVHFEQALGIEPDFAEAHYNMGNVLVQQGRLSEAIGSFRKALEIQPDFAEAHNNLGNALLEKGLSEQAIFHFGKALEFRPDFAEAHFNFGRVLLQKGHVDRAIAHLQRALEIKPEFPEARRILDDALLRKGR